jgi:hypothetical protein
MSIATAISALQSASSDIASAITAKGVTVPSGSGFDDYATLIGQITSGGGGGGTLPYDAEVEYIAANGTQYIDTGITPTYASTAVIIDCQFTGDYSTTQILVGHGSSGGQWFGNNGSYYATGTKSTISSSTRRPWIIGYQTNKIMLASCGIQSISWTGRSAINFTNTLKLFCGNVDYFSNARIYSCRIYTGQTLSLDLIPVRKGTVGQFYDRVSGNFFTNAGSGSFLYGNDI